MKFSRPAMEERKINVPSDSGALATAAGNARARLRQGPVMTSLYRPTGKLSVACARKYRSKMEKFPAGFSNSSADNDGPFARTISTLDESMAEYRKKRQI